MFDRIEERLFRWLADRRAIRVVIVADSGSGMPVGVEPARSGEFWFGYDPGREPEPDPVWLVTDVRQVTLDPGTVNQLRTAEFREFDYAAAFDRAR